MTEHYTLFMGVQGLPRHYSTDRFRSIARAKASGDRLAAAFRRAGFGAGAPVLGIVVHSNKSFPAHGEHLFRGSDGVYQKG